MSIFWLIFAIVMGVIEAFTVQLVSIWFAAGGLAACVTSLFTDNIWIQLLVAVAVTVVTLIATRPFAKRVINAKKTHTNSDKYIGKTGVVTVDINVLEGSGQVKVGPSVWSAKSVSDTDIPKDTKVVVKSIEGVKLFVEPIE